MEQIPAEFLSDAIDDLSEILNELKQINSAGGSALPPQFSQKLFRSLHTLKGSARTFGLDPEARIAHYLETFLKALQENKAPWNSASALLLTDSLQHLKENFTLISKGEQTVAPVDLLSELRAAVGEEDSTGGSLPDSFPSELSGWLSASELAALNLAWETGKEILILEFSFDKEKFASRFRELREVLNDAAQVIAVIAASTTPSTTNADKTAFRFVAAHDDAERMVRILRECYGRVLFQKQRSGEETVKSGFASNESEGALARAVSHGEMAAGISGKAIQFVLSGDDVHIPASLSQTVSTILLHLVRNAVDHGIEYPLERVVLQKPSRGTVEITAAGENDHLLIKVCDDGYGSESGDAMFAAGYSTAPFLTEFSGRGIGLDAVLDVVERANGTIETKSKPGRGTSFEVKLPLENK